MIKYILYIIGKDKRL